ncbi:MAG: CehA/McbA family metallohydrolase [Polyangiaceae bacterium]
MRRAVALGIAASLAIPVSAHADTVLVLDGVADAGEPDHFFVDFDVPAGTAEIQIEHDDLSDTDILDWGLYDPSGFRGWGGGNTEPIVIDADAASRSYLTGSITPGTWRLVVGKAKLDSDGGAYHAVITLREATTLAPQPERAPYADPGAVVSGARWYAGDFHVHSRESGDARPSLDEIVAFAKSRGLDFVELSDHNTTSQLDFMVDAQSRAGDFLLLPGVEFTTYAGHANGIGATAFVDHKIGQPGVTIDGAVDAFHDMGALFSINHPALDLGDVCIGCAWKHELTASKVDAVEIATAGSAIIFINDALAFWERLCDGGHHIAALGGSDDHTAGTDIGPFGAPIGSPATYVYADELSVSAILDAVRAGRTVVKVRGPEDPMIELSRRASDTSPTGLSLTATITGPSAGLQARWVKNGAAGDFIPIDGDGAELSLDVDPIADGAEDRYRLELWEGTNPVTFTSHVWLSASDVQQTSDPETVTPAGGVQCSARPPSAESYTPAVVALFAAVTILFGVRRRARII